MLSSPKYEPRQIDGGWIVWDTFRQQPANLSDSDHKQAPLSEVKRLTAAAATRAAARLNRAYNLTL